MNKNFHRVIFNAARRMRMVVQETARSVGKSTGTSTRMSSPRSTAVEILVFIASLTAISAAAQIASDRNAPANQRPTVLVAPNGVPLVNIRAPSAAGVSRNTYRQFDVDGKGAILNNSRTNVQTQLGGYVQGNPWLAAGSARVIVNEVNSSNPSYLRGFVEVAGPRAEVIIANPSGIYVDGGGFINANRATLTTGVPQFSPAGDLESYIVRRGTVSILGAGLDASTTDSLSILARAFELSGALHATELKVVAGANQVSTDLTGITRIDETGNAPAYAIDVAQLGGMYANHIALIVNEHGVGARSAGTIQTSTGSYALAGAGKLTLSADGLLENSGLIQTSSDAAISAARFFNSGTAQSAASLTIATQGDLANHIADAGGTLEGQRVELSSTAGSIGAGTDLSVQAGSIANTGTLRAERDSTISVTNALSNDGRMISGRHTTVNAGTVAGTLNNAAGRIASNGADVVLAATTLLNTGGTLQHAGTGALNISATTFSGANGNILGNGELMVQAGVFHQDGGSTSAHQISIAATDIGNVGGTIVQTGTGVTRIAATGTLSNDGGTIASNGANLNISAGGTLSNANGHLQHAGTGAVSLAAGNYSGANGEITTNNALVADVAGVFDQDGGSISAKQVTLHAGSLSNRGGEIVQTGTAAATLAVAGALDNSASGSIASNGNLTVTAASLVNQHGSVRSAGTASLDLATTGLLDNSASGVIGAGGNAVLRAGSLLNDAGSVTAAATAPA